MLHQPCNIGVVFQHKNGLAQPVSPRPAAVDFSEAGPLRIKFRLLQSGEKIANVV
jgi:hypothetical protein